MPSINKIYQGDWIEVLKSWPDEFVQCVITSPPYWGLRDYGVEGQLGLEKTPEEYLEKMVAGFREVRRVMRDDATCWINMGDSYLAQQGSGFNGQKRLDDANRNIKVKRPDYLKPKNLCGIPWRLALALQADGWWLRSDIIWAKPNPMPESVKDRPTKSHEYIFLLTKSAKYYYDADAVREPLITDEKRTERIVYNGKSKETSTFLPPNPSGRNLRSVWTFATQSCSFAHFATFPEELVNRCILAGTAEQACGICGKPFKRVVEKMLADHDSHSKTAYKKGSNANRLALLRQAARKNGEEYQNKNKTLGFWPDCEHNYFPIMDSSGKCIVLDPFCGTNTVGYRAQEMGRQWLGIELNDKYIKYGEQRVNQGVLI